MLNIVKSSLLISALALSVTTKVNAADSINDALANICTIVQADDKTELRKKMKSVQDDFKLKLQDYYSGISCDGNSLIRTALLSNAEGTGTLLVKKMPKSALSQPENDGKTLQAWVSEKGLAANPIAQVLAERI